MDDSQKHYARSKNADLEDHILFGTSYLYDICKRQNDRGQKSQISGCQKLVGRKLTAKRNKRTICGDENTLS